MTALRARPGAVLAVLLRQSPVIACLTAVPAIAAVLEESWALAWTLGVPSVAMLALTFSGSAVPSDLRRIEGIVAFAGLFVVAIALTAPAFMVLGLRPVAAVFEATSGITTTGLTVAPDPDSWPVAAHVLRAWLQWCGGLAIAVGGSALLLNPGRAARTLAEPAIGDRDLHHSAQAQARTVLAVYAPSPCSRCPPPSGCFPGCGRARLSFSPRSRPAASRRAATASRATASPHRPTPWRCV